MNKHSSDTKDSKQDVVDTVGNYLRIIYLLCGLAVILTGIIVFFISTKIVPLEMKMVAAEDKLEERIAVNAKCLESTLNKEIFKVTIQTIQNDTQALKISQEHLNAKQVELEKKLEKNHNFIVMKLENISTKLE